MILGNTDSIAENLYYLLWIKEAGLKDSSFKVSVPDTIVIKGRQLTSWYFTSSSNKIMKKKPNSLTTEIIWEQFSEGVGKSGIVAQLIWGQGRREGTTKILESFQNKSLENRNAGSESVIIKYLGLAELKQFLFEEIPTKENLEERVILQKFIDPYGESNSMIEAIWSPSTCLFTRCVNNKKLNSLNYDAYERAATFDGPAVLSTSSCLKGKAISGEIRQLCEHIVKRVAHITYEKVMINRMTLYFKPDCNNKLYFLFCSSIRLKDEVSRANQKLFRVNNTPVQIGNNFKQPPNMKNTYSVSMTKPARLTNDVQCLNCKQVFQKEDLVDMPIQLLLRQDIEEKQALPEKQPPTSIISFKKKKEVRTEIILTNNQIMEHLSQASNDSPFDLENTKFFMADPNPPPDNFFLKKLFPKMTKEIFNELYKDGYFERAMIALCNDCYYHYTQNRVISGAELKEVEDIQRYKSHLAKQSSLFDNEYFKKTLPLSYELASSSQNIVRHDHPEKYLKRLNDMYGRSTFKSNTINISKENQWLSEQQPYLSSSIQNSIQESHTQFSKSILSHRQENVIEKSKEIQQEVEEEDEEMSSPPIQEECDKDLLEGQNKYEGQNIQVDYFTLQKQRTTLRAPKTAPTGKSRVKIVKEKDQNQKMKTNEDNISVEGQEVRNQFNQDKIKMKETMLAPYLSPSLKKTRMLGKIIQSARKYQQWKLNDQEDNNRGEEQEDENFNQQKESVLKLYLQEDSNSKTSNEYSLGNSQPFYSVFSNAQDTTLEITNNDPSTQNLQQSTTDKISFHSCEDSQDPNKGNLFDDKRKSLGFLGIRNKGIKVRLNKGFNKNGSEDLNSQERPLTTQTFRRFQVVKNPLQIINEDQILQKNPLNAYFQKYSMNKLFLSPYEQPLRINGSHSFQTSQHHQKNKTVYTLNQQDANRTKTVQTASMQNLNSSRAKNHNKYPQDINLLDYPSIGQKFKIQESKKSTQPSTARNTYTASNSFFRSFEQNQKVVSENTIAKDQRQNKTKETM